MLPLENVPPEFWRVACHKQNHPLACVTSENRFFWVNEAWERLLGYSSLEITQKTWIEVTVAADIGGDLASARAILEGRLDRYSMTKRYIHKMGHVVKVTMTVFRLPQSSEPFLCFIVEAIPEMAHLEDLEELRKSQAEQNQRVHVMITELVGRLEESERKRMNETKNESKNTITLNQAPAWIGGVILALIAAAGYLAYISGWGLHGGDAKPPHQHGDSVDLRDT